MGFDQFVHHPFGLFPVFYMVKGFVEGDSVSVSFKKMQNNWQEDCLVCWKVRGVAIVGDAR